MATEDYVHTLLSQTERTQYMLDLMRVVKETGDHVLNIDREKVFDTVEVARHQFSTVDAEANSRLRAILEMRMKMFPGTVLEESDIPRARLEPDRLKYPLLICDAVEGSTNAKRGLAAYMRRPILAGTLAMVVEGEELSMIAASAFYDFSSRKVLSSVRTEAGCFLSFIDGQIIDQSFVLETKGDSHVYAIVPGYSHANVGARAAIESMLLTVGIESAGGSRSSAQDLVSIFCNQADAYVDLRALFPGSTEIRDEVLHTWDVGGLLPVLDSVGFRITDITGQSWQRLRIWDRMAIIVSRPTLQSRIVDVLKGLSFVSSLFAPETNNVINFPTPNIG